MEADVQYIHVTRSKRLFSDHTKCTSSTEDFNLWLYLFFWFLIARAIENYLSSQNLPEVKKKVNETTIDIILLCRF